MVVSLVIVLTALVAPASGQNRQESSADSGSIRDRAFGNYLIGAGDVLDVEVFELEELSKTVRVSGDGRITYDWQYDGAVLVGGRRELRPR